MRGMENLGIIIRPLKVKNVKHCYNSKLLEKDVDFGGIDKMTQNSLLIDSAYAMVKNFEAFPTM